MKWSKSILFAVIFLSISSMSFAQRGTGNKAGIARNNSNNVTESISGRLLKILNEPCTNTTGRYDKGMHFIVDRKDKGGTNLNIHLGPASEVSEMTNHLKPGQEIRLKVFKTEDLPDNQFIAKSFTSNNETYKIRDDDFRPFWAVKRNNRSQRWSVRYCL